MGANYLLLNMNVGAMAHDVFLEQIRRFGKEVLPRLQAHQVKRVPAAEQWRRSGIERAPGRSIGQRVCARLNHPPPAAHK